MTPEAKVKKRVKDLLTHCGVNQWHFKPVSNGMGTHGVPDFICCFHGQFIAIECKAGKGKLTGLQEMQIGNIKSAGGAVFIVNDNITSFVPLAKYLETIAARHREVTQVWFNECNSPEKKQCSLTPC